MRGPSAQHGVGVRTAAAVRRRVVAVRIAVAYLAVAAGGRLAYALPRLVRDLEDWSAWDLRYRWGEVQHWFAGNPVYGVVDGAVYPPAAHVILWPFLGWTDFDTARWIWAATTLIAAFVLAIVAFRAVGTGDAWHRLLVAGLAFAAYPVQQSIFVGQMGVHVAAFVAVGAALLFRRDTGLPGDAAAACALACALLKPTVALPPVAAALIAARRWRPALLTVTVYAALSFVAISQQPGDAVTLVRDWLAVAGDRVPVLEGVPNLHMLLARLELRAWMTPASLAVLAVMSGVMLTWRDADPWVLLGIAAVVARFWAHSALYDDVILLLPVVALFRLHAAQPDRASAVTVLFALSWLALLTPTWAFYDLPVGVRVSLHAAQAVVWLGVLAFLVSVNDRPRGVDTGGNPERPAS